MNENFDAYFDSLDVVEKEKSQRSSREPREQKVLYLTSSKTQGRVTFRLISDKEVDANGNEVNRPIRVISGVYELSLPVPAYNEDGTPKVDESGEQIVYNNRYRICMAENYLNKLTVAQANLLQETMDTIDAFNALCGENEIKPYDVYGMNIKWRQEVALWWGKVLSFSSSVGTENVIDRNNKVFLMRAASPRFMTAFHGAQKQKTEVQGSGAWRGLSFSRNPQHNNYVCTVTTVLGGTSVGYNFTIGFDRLDNGYELTQADIDQCTDLNVEYLDATSFNVELHEFLKKYFEDAIKMVKDSLGASDGLQAAPEKMTSTPAIQSAPSVANVGVAPQTPAQPQVAVPPTMPKFKIPTSL